MVNMYTSLLLIWWICSFMYNTLIQKISLTKKSSLKCSSGNCSWSLFNQEFTKNRLWHVQVAICSWSLFNQEFTKKIVSDIFKWQFVHDLYSTKNVYTCTEPCTLIHIYIEVCIVVKMRVTLDILFTASSIA